MYAKRVDANHAVIREAFRDMGASVFDSSSIGRGFPDLVVGINNRTALVEIKSHSKARFTEDQLSFMQNWKGGTVYRIEDVSQVETLIKLMKKK